MSEVIPNTGGVPDDGSPEGHVEKMAGMTDLNAPQGESAPAPEVPQRPDNIPEKFWNAEKGEVNTEALLKSQSDLEKQVRGGKKPEEGESSEEDAGQEQVNVVEAAAQQFAQTGELNEDSFAALEKVGISRDMVNDYINGQQAIVSNLQSAAYEPFGGNEGYETAADWAAANLSEDEIKALDVQLTSTNPAIVAQGAQALFSRYSAEADVEPSAIRGGGNNKAPGAAYQSSAEMMRDMADPRYRTDSAFREEVAQKLARSNL